jgi:muconolactone delta-isomerase
VAGEEVEMKFIVVAEPISAADRHSVQAEETRVVSELRKLGVIEQIFARADGAASITVLEAASEEAARRHIESLPFFVHGCMTVEIFEVRVID